jgi:hypothetical protein
MKESGVRISACGLCYKIYPLSKPQAIREANKWLLLSYKIPCFVSVSMLIAHSIIQLHIDLYSRGILVETFTFAI